MDDHQEKRRTRRFPQAGRVEISVHGRTGWSGMGSLVDCSEGGLGFEVSKGLKTGTVVLLRMMGPMSTKISHDAREAVRFNMVTAKVRWCREISSPAGISVFRIGARRMLPFY